MAARRNGAMWRVLRSPSLCVCRAPLPSPVAVRRAARPSRSFSLSRVLPRRRTLAVVAAALAIIPITATPFLSCRGERTESGNEGDGGGQER